MVIIHVRCCTDWRESFDACIVKEKQLDYSYAKSLTLGNLLNVEEIEKVDVHDADIKNFMKY